MRSSPTAAAASSACCTSLCVIGSRYCVSTACAARCRRSSRPGARCGRRRWSDRCRRPATGRASPAGPARGGRIRGRPRKPWPAAHPRRQARLQLVEETKVEVDVLVDRAVERPNIGAGAGRNRSAGSSCTGWSWRLIGRAALGEGVLPVGLDAVDVADDGAVLPSVGVLAGLTAGDVAGPPAPSLRPSACRRRSARR